MEKEISFLEFFLMIARFIKRHFKKYVITLLVFILVTIGIYFSQKPVQRTVLYLSSDFFTRKEISSFVNSMSIIIVSQDSAKIKTQFGIKNPLLFKKIKKITCDTLQPVFTNISIDLTDTIGIKEINNGIIYFIKNNVYAKEKIERLYAENIFILKKMEQLENNSLNNHKEKNGKKINIVYTNENVLNASFYKQVVEAKKVIDEYNHDKIINFYHDFSFYGQVTKFWKMELIFFLILFFTATFTFFLFDINRLLK